MAERAGLASNFLYPISASHEPARHRQSLQHKIQRIFGRKDDCTPQPRSDVFAICNIHAGGLDDLSLRPISETEPEPLLWPKGPRDADKAV